MEKSLIFEVLVVATSVSDTALLVIVTIHYWFELMKKSRPILKKVWMNMWFKIGVIVAIFIAVAVLLSPSSNAKSGESSPIAMIVGFVFILLVLSFFGYMIWKKIQKNKLFDFLKPLGYWSWRLALVVLVIIFGFWLYDKHEHDNYGNSPAKELFNTNQHSTPPIIIYPVINEGENVLKAGRTYCFEKKSDTEYNFLRKNKGVTKLTLTLSGTNEYIKGNVNQHGFYPIEGNDPNKNGQFLVNVNSNSVIIMTVKKVI